MTGDELRVHKVNVLVQPKPPRVQKVVGPSSLWSNRARPYQCPRCDAVNFRRSFRRGPVEWLLRAIRVFPWRCLDCNHRFYAFRRQRP